MMKYNDVVLSFDLDGTLVSHDFSTAVWREAIPALVARRRQMPLPEAKAWVYEQYDRVGEQSLAWYDISYWHTRFSIPGDWMEILDRHRHLIRLYPEVPNALQRMGKRHRMIVLSNASRPFLRAEMEESGLDGLFKEVISATSDFGEVKKTPEFYERVCRSLGLDPSRLIHVGDHWEFDVLAPRSAGIRSYLVDRSGARQGPWVVQDIEVFAEKLERAGLEGRVP